MKLAIVPKSMDVSFDFDRLQSIMIRAPISSGRLVCGSDVFISFGEFCWSLICSGVHTFCQKIPEPKDSDENLCSLPQLRLIREEETLRFELSSQ